ncbi:MAG: phytanoyl-CoA dioxygenase family protein [Pseudomonadota bacterium]
MSVVNIDDVQQADPATAFRRDGFALLRGFYDLDSEIRPVQRQIAELIGLVAEKHGLAAPIASAHQAMTAGMAALIAADRRLGGVVYDAVKQIPAFCRLVSSEKSLTLFETLRPGALSAIAAGGFGVRIDHPNEDKFRTFWHQEFHGQLRSPGGVVFWSPLLPVDETMGPVALAIGSHSEGALPVYDDVAGGRAGAYALRLADEDAALAGRDIVRPLTEPGDLLAIDFLTLHRSGLNRAAHARWSMQFRYYDFLEPVGRTIDWAGSYAAGTGFAALFPALRASDSR